VGRDLNSVRVWYCSVDITKVEDTCLCSSIGWVQYGVETSVRTTQFLYCSWCFSSWLWKEVLWCACVCATATASKCLWYSVVPSCRQLQHSGGTSSRRRTQDQSERINAQTVTLQSKSAGWTFSGWGPIRCRMGWVLAANQVRHSTDTSLSWCQSGPRLAMITTSRARQLCIWCGSRHDSGRRLRSSWQPCGCDFFI
jgi:hypothetical protein